MTTSVSTLVVLPSLAFSGRVGTLHTPLFGWKASAFVYNTVAWLQPILLGRLVCLVLNMLTTGMSGNYGYAFVPAACAFSNFSIGGNGCFHRLSRRYFPGVLHWPQEKLLGSLDG